MLQVVFLAVIGIAYAQQPTPCETPKQWQGKFIRRDEKMNYTRYADISYDDTNRRVREVEYIDDTQGKFFYDVLYLHNINKEYRIDLKSRKCNVSTITRPFRPFGIPPMAKYVGTANIGPVNIATEHATVIMFEGEDRQSGDKFFGEVTTPDCVPVSNGFFSEKYGFEQTNFFDITAGISDPSVFIPPTNCSPA